MNDKISLPARGLLEGLKIKTLFSYKKYVFDNSYNKMYISIKDVLVTYPLVIPGSLVPFDISFENMLLDYKKKLFLLYNSFSFKHYCSLKEDYLISTCEIQFIFIKILFLSIYLI